MFKLSIIVIVLLSSFQLASAAITSFEHSDGGTLWTPDLKFCLVCQEQGLTSSISIEIGICTSMFCGNGSYDEEGYYTPPKDCNTCSTNYKCSQGHSWAESY